MIYTIYKIDDKGMYVDNYLSNNKGEYYDGVKFVEIDFEYVGVRPPDVKKTKWEDGTWVIIEEYPKEHELPIWPTDIEILSQSVYEIAEILELILLGGIE